MTDQANMQRESLAGGTASRRGMLLIAVLLVLGLSLGLRIWNLKSPLTEAHSFRQTQTAFTVAVFVQKGISWLHPQMPVYGPPWEVPFEFPLYQATAAVVARVTGFNVDLACRTTSLACFYLSAAMLYLLCRELFRSRAVCAAVMVVYLFSPFNVLWSRAALMEYAAVSFALGFVYCALRWCRSSGQWWWLALYVMSGALGTLTKITTMAITVPPILAIMYCGLCNGRDLSSDGFTTRPGRRSMLAAVGLGVGALVCIAVGQMWVSHADAIKAGSPATRWLTSSALTTWNYGTLAQRCSVVFWQTVLGRSAGCSLRFSVPGCRWRGWHCSGRNSARFAWLAVRYSSLHWWRCCCSPISTACMITTSARFRRCWHWQPDMGWRTADHGAASGAHCHCRGSAGFFVAGLYVLRAGFHAELFIRAGLCAWRGNPPGNQS